MKITGGFFVRVETLNLDSRSPLRFGRCITIVHRTMCTLLSSPDKSVNCTLVKTIKEFTGNNSNNENELSQVIINIEAQKDEPKKYQIINRAVFYISRLVSSQKQRDFINMNYEDIKKVYSIWVCMGMKENTMCHIHLTKDDLIGKHNWRGNLDLLNIVMIGISDTLPEHDNTYEMHRLLVALFTNTLNAKQKIDIINKEYDIPVESDIAEGVSIMCNLSQGIEEKALEKGRITGIAEGKAIGITQGIAQGKTSAQIDIILNMYNNNFTIEQIALATQYDVRSNRARSWQCIDMLFQT